MLVEHTFVTTYDGDVTIQMAADFLETLGFRIESASPQELRASRGRKRPTTRKVTKLPQAIHLTYDRGRVTVAASIMPRNNKERPIHAELMTALVRSLEQLLASQLPGAQCEAIWLDVETRAGSLWPTSEVVILVVLSVFILAMVIVVIFTIASM